MNPRGVVMRKIIALLAAGLLLAACGQDSDRENVELDAVTTTDSMDIDGAAAYEEHCAGCHETGMLGAPQQGVPADWEGRSALWQAVLMEHAKTGYFDMPARGGKSDLPDEVVNAAAEYMLEQTFPDRAED